MSEAANDWTQKLPESLRGSKLVVDSKTEENFWKRIEDQQRHLGNSIRIPSNEASPEDLKDFSDKIQKRVPNLLELPKSDDDAEYSRVFSKLGKPEKADKYSVDGVQDLRLSDNDLASLRQAAYESDLTQRQFLKMVKKVNTDRDSSIKQNGEVRIADEKKLRSEWGAAFDERVSQVEKFLADSGAPEYLRDQFKGGSFSSEQMKWMHGMSKRMGEGSDLSGTPTQQTGGSSVGKLDPLEASQRLDEIYRNKAHPFHKPNDPAYKTALARVLELVALSNPE
jgi:hypothetical protein